MTASQIPANFTGTITITRDQLDDILDAAELYETDEDACGGIGEYGTSAIGVRAGYSGRAMFGEKCLGFTVSGPAAICRLMVGMTAALGAEEARQIAASAASDTMGRYKILYFPGVTLDA